MSNTPPILKVHMPNAPEGTYTDVGVNQVSRIYEDGVGYRCIIIIDEVAELLMSENVKTEAGKESDALKQEISAIINSLTQLGRSAAVNVVLATQRPDAKVITGMIKNNCLSSDTHLIVRRKK